MVLLRKYPILPDAPSAECVLAPLELNWVPHDGITEFADQFWADLSDKSTDVKARHFELL